MRNISDKIVEKIKHFMRSNFFNDSCAVYQIM